MHIFIGHAMCVFLKNGAPGGSKRPPRVPEEAPRVPQELLRSSKSLKSMNPKDLAPSRSKKKGRRAAVIPLGEVNPPPATCCGAGRARSKAKSVHRKALICLKHLLISKSEFLAPPIIPPGGQRIPPGRCKNTGAPILKSIKILIIF